MNFHGIQGVVCILRTEGRDTSLYVQWTGIKLIEWNWLLVITPDQKEIQ